MPIVATNRPAEVRRVARFGDVHGVEDELGDREEEREHECRDQQDEGPGCGKMHKMKACLCSVIITGAPTCPKSMCENDKLALSRSGIGQIWVTSQKHQNKAQKRPEKGHESPFAKSTTMS